MKMNKSEAKRLWKMLEDIPVDENDCIEIQFFDKFPIGTSKYDLWHWFEETFDVAIEELK